MIVSASDTINLRHAIDAYVMGNGYDDSDNEEKLCPVCGEWAREFFYNTVFKDILGCVHCVNTIYADEI